MKVKLIALSQPLGQIPQNIPYNPSIVAEQCASVCYDSKPTKTFKIMKSCIKSGHLSTIEHISFTFYISGVSRSLLAQLSRHRHVSLSVQSQRYCKLDNQEWFDKYGCGFEYVQPKFTDGFEETRFIRAMQDSSKWYRELLECETSKEDARAVLPNACCTELYMTANARALIEMSYLRLCSRAQSEIHNMFILIKQEVAKYCPEIAEHMVPKCEIHEVPFCEEEKCCGKHTKLKSFLDKVQKVEINEENSSN